ncbi:uncharacterized protein Z519_12144 [Cladophialophora bantiana CBS 173.52]|uniref:Uncharacterized protein n=1 Tax=Cladophialophora bantiana (strain ATCC 10958 / CBS 173.52 / CDC B-1940 / NIH 8579) TaxID=1442370 RepID=A0A0D2EAS0_CLAB1|nr:uncharacterized protein Z519_12144 [Cladophialophora bantiana CBS 173.52]KIW87241.1 hypothetical protein Z519_12144 [Cladophialophora bantiana CBS 173.52]
MPTVLLRPLPPSPLANYNYDLDSFPFHGRLAGLKTPYLLENMLSILPITAIILLTQNVAVDILGTAAYRAPQTQTSSWQTPLNLFVCYRQIQTSLAIMVLLATFISGYAEKVSILMLVGAMLLCEASAELICLYFLLRHHFFRRETAICWLFTLVWALSFGIAAPLSQRFQLTPFCLCSVVSQILQIVIWSYLYKHVFIAGYPLLKSTELGRYHCLWGQGRAFFVLALSIALAVLSAFSSHHQPLYAIVCGNLIILVPTPKTFVRYNRSKRRTRFNMEQQLEDSTNPSKSAVGSSSIEELEGKKLAVVGGSSIEEVVAHSKRQAQKLSTCTISTTMVQKDGHTFHYSHEEQRYLYLMQDPGELCKLQDIRHRTPWPVICPPEQCTADEFMQLAQSWPLEHPYMRGTPSLYDIFRDIFNAELQRNITDFQQKVACDKCLDRKCFAQYRLMFLLLLNEVGSKMRVRFDEHGDISAQGTTIIDLWLTGVQFESSSTVRITFDTNINQKTVDVGLHDLWKLNSFGIYLTVPPIVAHILPSWNEYPAGGNWSGTWI